MLKSAELLFEKLDNVITEITSEDYDISLDCIDYMVADIESAKLIPEDFAVENNVTSLGA